jgi:L-lactate dehydrogenase complex protein LldG
VAAREEILAALRRNAPPLAPAPALDELGVVFTDPVAELARSVAAVGGMLVRGASVADAVIPVARRVITLVTGAGVSTVDLDDVDDPHALADLDLAVLPGELAVAENGAVWVESHRLGQRAVFVIAEHLVLVVAAADVVSNLHQAYARLEGRRRGHGVFISGPSKTADIEQALVVGAQGARTCTVVVVG